METTKKYFSAFLENFADFWVINWWRMAGSF
jgi:hypothetical protein